jgi:uncharacterized protein
VILLDTSGVLSALFPDQVRHAESSRILLESEPPRLLSPFVLAEIDYLIQKFAGPDTETSFLDEVARGAYELAPFEAKDIDAAITVIERYSNHRIGLADASIAVLAARHRAFDVLTLDERHFRAIRPLPRKSFRILPADA